MAIGGRVFDMNLRDDPFSFKVDLLIAHPNSKITKCKALSDVLLDTGATNTFLPLSVIRELELPATGGPPLKITGYDKRKHEEFDLYHARIRLEGVDEAILEVGGWDNAPVIGRDLLNRWHILLNGPHTTFEIVSDKDYKLGE
jgi:predicted aspartyl protease